MTKPGWMEMHAMYFIATPEIYGVKIPSIFECFYTDISTYAVTSEKCTKTLYGYVVVCVMLDHWVNQANRLVCKHHLRLYYSASSKTTAKWIKFSRKSIDFVYKRSYIYCVSWIISILWKSTHHHVKCKMSLKRVILRAGTSLPHRSAEEITVHDLKYSTTPTDPPKMCRKCVANYCSGALRPTSNGKCPIGEWFLVLQKVSTKTPQLQYRTKTPVRILPYNRLCAIYILSYTKSIVKCSCTSSNIAVNPQGEFTYHQHAWVIPNISWSTTENELFHSDAGVAGRRRFAKVPMHGVVLWLILRQLMKLVRNKHVTAFKPSDVV